MFFQVFDIFLCLSCTVSALYSHRKFNAWESGAFTQGLVNYPDLRNWMRNRVAYLVGSVSLISLSQHHVTFADCLGDECVLDFQALSGSLSGDLVIGKKQDGWFRKARRFSRSCQRVCVQGFPWRTKEKRKNDYLCFGTPARSQRRRVASTNTKAERKRTGKF